MRGADPTKKNFELLQNKKKHNIQIKFEFFPKLYQHTLYNYTIRYHSLSSFTFLAHNWRMKVNMNGASRHCLRFHYGCLVFPGSVAFAAQD